MNEQSHENSPYSRAAQGKTNFRAAQAETMAAGAAPNNHGPLPVQLAGDKTYWTISRGRWTMRQNRSTNKFWISKSCRKGNGDSPGIFPRPPRVTLPTFAVSDPDACPSQERHVMGVTSLETATRHEGASRASFLEHSYKTHHVVLPSPFTPHCRPKS